VVHICMLARYVVFVRCGWWLHLTLRGLLRLLELLGLLAEAFVQNFKLRHYLISIAKTLVFMKATS
jgi:hypothetical protein